MLARAGLTPRRRALTDVLLEQDQLERPRFAAAGLRVALAAVESLSRPLADRRLQHECAIAKLRGSLLEAVKHAPAKAPSLRSWVHAYPFDLCADAVSRTQGAHCNDPAVLDPDEELAAALEVRRRDRRKIVVPGTAQIVVKRQDLELPDRFAVRVSVAP